MPERLQAAPRVAVGTKQTLKALQSGEAVIVYVAEDADPSIVEPVRTLCVEEKVSLVTLPSMESLGRLCRIEVGAAAASVLR